MRPVITAKVTVYCRGEAGPVNALEIYLASTFET
jgi:hypothetical protein